MMATMRHDAERRCSSPDQESSNCCIAENKKGNICATQHWNDQPYTCRVTRDLFYYIRRPHNQQKDQPAISREGGQQEYIESKGEQEEYEDVEHTDPGDGR